MILRVNFNNFVMFLKLCSLTLNLIHHISLFFSDASAALKAAVQEAAASLDGSAVAASGAMGGDMSIPYGAAENYYYYDRSKSFYDKISCTSIEKMRQQYTQPVVTPAACK